MKPEIENAIRAVARRCRDEIIAARKGTQHQNTTKSQHQLSTNTQRRSQHFHLVNSAQGFGFATSCASWIQKQDSEELWKRSRYQGVRKVNVPAYMAPGRHSAAEQYGP
ncbi:hypothetical protein AU509_07320 [Lonsdalea britannica]|nr:hypothetical protein AU509_07320 [Lonsdalea britannica]